MSASVVDNTVSSGNSSVAIPTDISGQILDLDEDDDLEVFSKDTSTTQTDGSSFNASMQTSPASMINQYKFEEEEEDADTKDIFVTVDNPESHVTAIETYITYRVETKTTRSEFDSSEFEVRRRYQDFLWLKGRLEEAHPTLIVHPLPEKFVMKGMVERFNEDFIETRRRALHKFLNKIAEHPIFSSSEDFKIFLTAGSGELTSHKKQGPGFLSRMGETVKAVAAAVRGVRNRPQEFTDMQEYAEAFSQKISSLDKVTQRIVREQKEYLEELKECGPTYALWSQSEQELAEPLKNVAGCVDNCCKETEEQAVLRRRDNIQADFEGKTEALATKKADRDAVGLLLTLSILHDSKVLSLAWDSLVGRSPEEVKQQKQQKLKGEIKEMRDELDKAEDRLEWANNALKTDWTRWQKVMRTDLRSAFIDTAERNVSYYEKCLAVWESFLQSQRTDAEGNGNVDSS
ncbi:hypothetical protein cypCar_00038226 [Cyprinus carpio]|nr:hypothetical protein cypCar_00038226 [Cyprinus carpio]